MKKIFLFLIFCCISLGNVIAQSDDDYFTTQSEEELFAVNSDDELFATDDDMFSGSGIEEVTDVKAKSDLSKGVIFQNGSVKIGGSFTTGVSTMTKLYADDNKNFGEHISETIFTPDLSAFLTVDARPTEILRMYTKFGVAYPFKSAAFSTAQTSLFKNPMTGQDIYTTKVQTSVTDYLKLKEIFTDFSVADRAFFRFGIHTVTWGAGYFFSPVSDMINTSSINPEDPTAQVDGSLNFRTQIVFPGSQNCLWFYVIPSTDFTQGASSYLRDTALAGKADIMIGNYELGVGAFWKYQHAPKIMLTGTGAIKKVSLFAEAVYSYGAESEWSKNSEWNDKKSIFQATFGLNYLWKDPSITFAAQYYYDGNDVDLTHMYLTAGHNIAGVVSFGKIFGTTDFTANIFAMVNFGKEPLPEAAKAAYGDAATSFVNAMTVSAMLNYSPISVLKFGFGPYFTWADFDGKPVVSLKLSATLGGGRF
ncbi:MAG: hypothetical protein HUK25_06720 [Treponema sp.]|nr:hypothetical protein [Treponema sp.]